MSYAVLGAAGKLIAGSGFDALTLTLMVGAALSMTWYVKPRLRWLPSPRRQARRELVERARLGALAFGGILGVGWLTVVVTPYVWLGVAACIASGSVLWGGLYGAGFGAGRTAQLFAHWIRGADDPTDVVLRTVVAQVRVSQMLGLAGGATIAAASVWSLLG